MKINIRRIFCDFNIPLNDDQEEYNIILIKEGREIFLKKKKNFFFRLKYYFNIIQI